VLRNKFRWEGVDMNNTGIIEQLNKVHGIFAGAFITLRNELVVDRKHNIYMPLNNVNDELDFLVKAVQCFSRDCCKGGQSERKRKEFRGMVNKLLDVDFSENEWRNIYTYCNSKSFIERFVSNCFDLDVIKEKGWHED